MLIPAEVLTTDKATAPAPVDHRNRFAAGVLPTFEPESDSFYANPDGKLGTLLFADRMYYLNLPLVVPSGCRLNFRSVRSLPSSRSDACQASTAPLPK